MKSPVNASISTENLAHLFKSTLHLMYSTKFFPEEDGAQIYNEELYPIMKDIFEAIRQRERVEILLPFLIDGMVFVRKMTAQLCFDYFPEECRKTLEEIVMGEAGPDPTLERMDARFILCQRGLTPPDVEPDPSLKYKQ